MSPITADSVVGGIAGEVDSMFREIGGADAALAVAHRWSELGTLFRAGCGAPGNTRGATAAGSPTAGPDGPYPVPAGSRGVRTRRPAGVPVLIR